VHAEFNEEIPFPIDHTLDGLIHRQVPTARGYDGKPASSELSDEFRRIRWRCTWQVGSADAADTLIWVQSFIFDDAVNLYSNGHGRCTGLGSTARSAGFERCKNSPWCQRKFA